MSQIPTDIAYLLALMDVPKIGRKMLIKFAHHFTTWEEVFHATTQQLQDAGAKTAQITAIHNSAQTSLNTEELLAPYHKYNITIITHRDASYPPLLREVPDAPPVLFVRGDISALTTTPAVTIVGSRAVTSYGRQATRTLSSELARAGVTIISGLALGIDAIAHRGALDADGVTIGVLGSSIDDDNIQPRTNYALARDICTNGGCILSEYPLITPATAYTFPARNRIMAGLAHATLVVEAAEKSGTLITAHDALEYNRDIFAVPGSIFSKQSRGANNLIKRGAKIVTSVADILEELPALTSPVAQNSHHTPPNLTETEQKIFQQLSGEPLHIDAIIRATKLPATEVTTSLAMMEINGIVRNIGGQNYIQGM